MTLGLTLIMETKTDILRKRLLLGKPVEAERIIARQSIHEYENKDETSGYIAAFVAIVLFGSSFESYENWRWNGIMVLKMEYKQGGREIHTMADLNETLLPQPVHALTQDICGYFGVSLMSDVNWEHGINSYAALHTVLSICKLRKKSVMVEADIIMGHHIDSENVNDEPIAVMGHPPDVVSDLTFDEFLDSIIAHNVSCECKDDGRVGLKLDFKNPMVVRSCLDVIRKRSKELINDDSNDLCSDEHDVLGVPLMLNADILQGPGGNASLFCPLRFIDDCLDILPTAVISIGWTTGYNIYEGSPFRGYTSRHVDDMLALCRRFKLTAVTFPLRGSLVPCSWTALQRLLEHDKRYTVTLWGAVPDAVMMWAYEHDDSQRMYLDMRQARTHEAGLWRLINSIGFTFPI